MYTLPPGASDIPPSSCLPFGAPFVRRPALRAQQALYAVSEGKAPALVQAARGPDPLVEVDGARGRPLNAQYALGKVAEFLPVFVSCAKWSVAPLPWS